MKSFKSHLKQKLQNPEFKSLYDEEKEILDLALRIHDMREKHKITQSELAKRAGITQQQLSRLENGNNVNVGTFLKVCNALNVKVALKPQKRVASA